MRIALLSYRSKPHCGGQGIYVRHLSRELVNLGHSVEVFSGQPYPELDPGVELTKVPSLDLYREPDPFRIPRTERTTGCSENEARQPAVPPSHALQHGAVLGVDRNDLASSGASRLGHQVPGHHQSLLVGQGHALSRLERRQRGFQARSTDYRIHDDVGVGMSGGFYQHVGSGGPARILVQTGKRGICRLPFSNLSLELIPVPAGGQRNQPKVLLLAP